MADLWVLTVSEAFDAAHFLPGYNGPCGNLHGHTWRIEATWAYNTLSAGDMCEDFGDLKQRLRAILPDHKLLNDVYSFAPTAENLARHFCDLLGACRVTLWETETSYVTYSYGE